jgi:PKHD-type hydroxylase
LKLRETKIEPFISAKVFTEAQLNSIIDLGYEQIQEESRLAAGENDSRTRTCKISWLYPTQKSQWIFDTIIAGFVKLNQENYGFDLDQFEPLQFTRYDSGRREFYGPHVDCAYGIVSQMTSRKLSMTIQLSDSDDYTGGDLKLHVGHKQPLVAPRERGSVIVFPSNILHEVTPVKSGRRYSLVTWAHGPLFR